MGEGSNPGRDEVRTSGQPWEWTPALQKLETEELRAPKRSVQLQGKQLRACLWESVTPKSQDLSFVLRLKFSDQEARAT